MPNNTPNRRRPKRRQARYQAITVMAAIGLGTELVKLATEVVRGFIGE